MARLDILALLLANLLFTSFALDISAVPITFPAITGPLGTLPGVTVPVLTIVKSPATTTSTTSSSLGASTSAAVTPISSAETTTTPVSSLTTTASTPLVSSTTNTASTSLVTFIPMSMTTVPAMNTSAPSPSNSSGAMTSSQGSVPMTMNKGKGPFEPPTALFGGIPSPLPDIPITAFFMVLFIIAAIAHFRIHSVNGKKGHKFHISTLMFDFCMVRTLTMILRMVWATDSKSVSLELTALIFEFAGSTVVELGNIYFAQRILRACHGNFGYHPVTNFIFSLLKFSVPAIILHNVLIVVLSYFTTNIDTLDTLRVFQLFGSSYTMFLAFFPIPLILLATWIPGSRPVEKFGTGSFRNKVAILLYASATLTVGSVFRLSAAITEDLRVDSKWYESKGALYISTFGLEIIIAYLYIFTRVDQRFHVPDGASKAGDYAKGYPQHGWLRLRRTNSDAEKGFAADTSGIDGFGADKETPVMNGGNDLQQIKSTIERIAIGRDIVGYPVETGDDLLVYVFKKNSVAGWPRRPGSSAGVVGLPPNPKEPNVVGLLPEPRAPDLVALSRNSIRNSTRNSRTLNDVVVDVAGEVVGLPPTPRLRRAGGFPESPVSPNRRGSIPPPLPPRAVSQWPSRKGSM